MKVIRRELPIRWEEHSIRWMRVETADGPIRAIGFPASRKSSIYLQGLDTDTVVEALATAAGERGSMAEYLRNTILQLEARGVHDAYLWRMQALVAVRIEALWGAP